jgi:hypothetical protein
MENFEKILTQMPRPEIPQLKHQDILADEIVKSKEKSVVSWWWLSVPLYIVAALLMKSIFMPQTSLISNIHELIHRDKYTSSLLFIILPLMLIVINSISIKRIYYLLGNPKDINFLKMVWLNVFIIFCSILVIIIYSL